ncbi:MAG: outer membrane protein transport protein, partial [Pseudoalteromonas distincta]
MTKSITLRTALALAVAAASTQALANGVAINEQSASSMGTGFAGRSSSAQDASTVFGNPAGMSKLDRAQVSGGFAA